MEREVTHFLADAERSVGLECIFADCTIIRLRGAEWHGNNCPDSYWEGTCFEFRPTQSLSSVVCLVDSRKFREIT